MGKVVELDTSGKGQPRGQRAKRRREVSKTALVLGGGGFTGGVYEIGALRALDLLAVNHTVNEFDIYVGTSAGSFIASLTANGVTPEEMMRVLNADLRSPIPDIDLSMLLRPNYRGFLRSSLTLPLKVAGILKEVFEKESSIVDLATGLAGLAPPGFYRGTGIERYVREVLSDPDRTDDFRHLAAELYLTATDLDTTERVVLGEGEWADVPISKAVAASGALPMIYEPVEIKGHEFIDGGILSTTNIDVAVERGAQFIVVINPLVPYVNDFGQTIPTVTGSRVQHVSDMGLAGIGNQVFRMMSHDRLHRAVDIWEERYPGVDIVLIEPELDDALMFGTSILDYRARLEIAKHGFESVTLKLARDYDRYRAIAKRHGIEISKRRVRHAMDHVERAAETRAGWRRVLEQTTSTLMRSGPKPQPEMAEADSEAVDA